MTDTPASPAALGIEPVAWQFKHPRYRDEISRTPLIPAEIDNGWTETPLYSATDLAPLTQRIKELEAALRDLLDLDQRSGWHSKQADAARSAMGEQP